MKKSIEDNKKELIDEITEIVEREDSPSEDSLGISFAKDGINKPAMKVESNQDSYDATHGSLYKMTHENTIPWRNYLIYGIILTMLSCCICFAKYINAFSGANQARVANFSYSISGSDSTDVIISGSKWNDGKDNTYSFDDIDEAYFTFDIENKSEVPVKVIPTPSIKDDNDKEILSELGFDVSFYNVEPTDSTTPTQYITIHPHSTGSIWMKIDATGVSSVDDDMNLQFTVEQID